MCHQGLPQGADNPLGMGVPDGSNFVLVLLAGNQLVQPLVQGAGRYLPEHGIDQCRRAGADDRTGQADRLVKGRVGRYTHCHQLVDPDAQGIQDSRIQLVQGPVHAAGEDGVVGSLVPQRPVTQFGGESGVAPVEAVLPDARRQHQIGVGVLGRDRAQNFKRHQPGRVCPAGALRRCALGEVALGAAVALPSLRIATAGFSPAPALVRTAGT
jgi:hypothetical protein